MNEEEILELFVRKKILNGEYFTEIPVGMGTKEERDSGIRRIDAICVTSPLHEPSDSFLGLVKHVTLQSSLGYNLRSARQMLKGKSVWILEAKRRLNAEVIGQAITAKELFALDYPDVRIVGLGVIVEESDDLLSKVCHNLGIDVFQI